MATFNKFETFVGDLGLGNHGDLNSAGTVCKVYLSNAAPSTSADSVLLDLADLAQGTTFGYTAGGEDAQQTWSETTGTGTLAGVDIVWTASGGTIGPFQYAVLYNDTPTSPADPLIGWWDYGSAITLQDGETFTVDFGASILTIT